MKPVFPITVVTAWLVSAAWSVPQAARQTGAPAASTTVPKEDAAANRATIDRYCVGCHNERTKTGGLVLEKADLADASSNAEGGGKVGRRLRAGPMPPQGGRRPDEAAAHQLRASLERDLDRAAAAHPDPGRPML